MKNNYSKYLKPLLLLIDLTSISLMVLFVSDKDFFNTSFLIFILNFWLFSSFVSNFYKVSRHTRLYQLIKILITQTLIFTLGYYAYFGFFREGEIINNQTKILLLIISAVWAVKLLSFFMLKIYRAKGNNYRRAIVLGYDSATQRIIGVLKQQKELGYKYHGFFSNDLKKHKEYKGEIEESFPFMLNKNINEVFCSIKDLTYLEIKKIKKFAVKNNIVVKLIPNQKELYAKDVEVEFYGESLIVLTLKKLPLEILENYIIKRIFDILFSLMILILIFSWLYPIIFILIKLESKGPVIFKQKREGVNGVGFLCYKFRSMKKSKKIDKGHTKKNDLRITKVGAFLRKTSIDELPQFINVLFGHMSVVGPRPHMNEHSFVFDKEVRNYMKRKSVKPGITGLAQISGYRGEIKMKSDIENRVRLDVFYIQNWSLMLDFKIIFKTFFGVFIGDEKAY